MGRMATSPGHYSRCENAALVGSAAAAGRGGAIRAYWLRRRPARPVDPCVICPRDVGEAVASI